MIDSRELRQTEQTTVAPAWDQQETPDWSEVRDVGPPETRPADELIRRYIARAMLRAVTKQYEEDGSWFAEIPFVPDIWGDGDTEEASLDKLASVLETWLKWKIDDKDRDIPPIDGIDLNMLS